MQLPLIVTIKTKQRNREEKMCKNTCSRSYVDTKVTQYFPLGAKYKKHWAGQDVHNPNQVSIFVTLNSTSEALKFLSLVSYLSSMTNLSPSFSTQIPFVSMTLVLISKRCGTPDWNQCPDQLLGNLHISVKKINRKCSHRFSVVCQLIERMHCLT